MISKKALEEFRQIWREEIGEEISDEKATGEAINLLTMMNAVYRPIKKEWIKELKDKSKLSGKDNEQSSTQ